jgi:hypothetical protein
MRESVFLPVLTRSLHDDVTEDFWDHVRRVQAALNFEPHELTCRPHIMQQMYDSWQYGNPVSETARWIADSINLE